MIRLTREHLVMKALAALRELAHLNSADPIRPGMAARFALAYLYSVSDGNREPFDGFWREMTAAYADHATNADYIRGTMMRTHLTGIARAVGIELTADVDERLGDMACSHEERQLRIAQREAIAWAKANIWKPVSGADRPQPDDLSTMDRRRL